MPCNTAHYYFNYVSEAVSIPVVHLIDLIVDNITRLVPGQKKVGVMASTAVLSTGLYEKRFQKHNVYSQGSEIFKNRWSDKERERKFHRGAKRKKKSL